MRDKEARSRIDRLESKERSTGLYREHDRSDHDHLVRRVEKLEKDLAVALKFLGVVLIDIPAETKAFRG